MSYKNNEFKKSALALNEEFKLPNGSYSVLYIQYYFKNVLRKPETITDNLSIMICVNKIGNRTTFKIKTAYYLKFLKFETKKILESTKSRTTKDKNSENELHLDIIEVVLVHCNIVNSDYQYDSRVLYAFYSQ